MKWTVHCQSHTHHTAHTHSPKWKQQQHWYQAGIKQNKNANKYLCVVATDAWKCDYRRFCTFSIANFLFCILDTLQASDIIPVFAPSIHIKFIVHVFMYTSSFLWPIFCATWITNGFIIFTVTREPSIFRFWAKKFPKQHKSLQRYRNSIRQ